MTSARRRGRGMYPKPVNTQQSSGVNRHSRRLPTYLTLDEVDALIRHAPIGGATVLIQETGTGMLATTPSSAMSRLPKYCGKGQRWHQMYV